MDDRRSSGKGDKPNLSGIGRFHGETDVVYRRWISPCICSAGTFQPFPWHKTLCIVRTSDFWFRRPTEEKAADSTAAIGNKMERSHAGGRCCGSSPRI